MMMRRLLMGVALFTLAGRADAAYVVTLIEDVANRRILATGSGSLNVSGLTPETGTRQGGYLAPSASTVLTGSVQTPHFYKVFAGSPQPFGTTSNGAFASSTATGDLVGLTPNFDGSFTLVVPLGYASGAALNSTGIFNRTFANLGIISGTYTYSYYATADMSGPALDTFTIQVGPAPVPEPASLAMLAVALGGLGLIARRSHRG